MIHVDQNNRRMFLRGTGVAMALPWLESLGVWGDEKAKHSGASATSPPKRLAVLFAGNGFHRGEWWARGQGKEMTFGKVLKSLHPFRERLLFIKGLYNAEALRGNIHSSMTGNLLSGAPLAAGGEIRSGTSFDQLISQRYGASTKVSSLALACERSNPGLHKNYSMIYSSHISWSSPTTPTPLELYPALAFDRLFAGSGERGDLSVLDAVLSEAKRLRTDVSASDRRRIDAYLSSVREVEQRIERAGKRGELQGDRPERKNLRPANGLPQDLSEHMRLMCDILVLGFQTDATRVCTLKLNNDHSYLQFPHLGIEVGHHELSHRNDTNYLKVNQFFLDQYAYIATKLDAIKEGGASVLDNSIIMLCSSMLHGGHDARNLPIVLLGGSRHFKGGRILDYSSSTNRKACRLYLSLLEKYGIELDRFGDAATKLDEL